VGQQLLVSIGGERFEAVLEDQVAPKSCEWLLRQLPYRSKLIHVRWSGEACWVPMGDLQVEVPPEEATRHPRPGQLILYPGGISETELQLAYGAVAFASKAGPLAGNPLLTVTGDLDRLAEIGRAILWEGAREFLVEAA
jgi:hypothetical protein